MKVAILKRENAIFFALSAKYSSVLNNKIEAKLPSHSCGLTD